MISPSDPAADRYLRRLRLSVLLTSLLGGWLYDRFAAAGAFGASALLMALGALLILLFVREPSRALTPAPAP